ncbi:MAG TPA: low molecular weight phosphatase family protein [Thermoplasmata archaeon]|nr:low molecular weight phosphatase family protein [Thermoplasmata archaeon]
MLCELRLLPVLLRLPAEELPTGLLLGLLLSSGRTVLFVCVGNAGRSLMAEAIFNADPPTGWIAESAGTEPAAHTNPRTEAMLREIGIPMPAHPPQLLTNAMIDRASRRFTMGCLDRQSCPARLKGAPLTDWQLPDPAGLDDTGFRRVRDEIRSRVAVLRSELSAAQPAR